MTETTNYKLKKPAGEDFFNVEDFNSNADAIDAELKKLNDDKANKDGSNASGTWDIDISGNAQTATNATNDGNGNKIEDTYSTKQELTDLEIGGRNLLSNNYMSTVLVDGNEYTFASTGIYQFEIFSGIYLEPGRYTLSMYIKKSIGIDVARVRVFIINSEGKQESINYYKPNNIDGEYTLLKIPIEVTDSRPYCAQLYNHSFTDEFDPSVSIKKVKLERGDKATDWTPAIEDTNNKFNNYLPLTGGSVSGTSNINGITTVHVYKEDSAGLPRYLKMFDITEWYKSDPTTSGYAKQSFMGDVYSVKDNGLMQDYKLKFYIGASWQKVNVENSSNLLLQTSDSNLIPLIVHDITNEKYYLCAKALYSYRNLYFHGCFRGTFIGEWIPNSSDSSNDYLPEGYEVAYDGYSPVKDERLNGLENSVANNLTTTTEGMVLDARQGKVLSDKIDSLGDYTLLGEVIAESGSASAEVSVSGVYRFYLLAVFENSYDDVTYKWYEGLVDSTIIPVYSYNSGINGNPVGICAFTEQRVKVSYFKGVLSIADGATSKITARLYGIK